MKKLCTLLLCLLLCQDAHAFSLIQLRRDTAANWTSADTVLSSGEPGYETDTGKLKIGDGSTAWTSLSYYTLTTGVVGALPVASGGTAGTDAQTAIDTLSAVSSATNEYVLTKDTATGHALFKVSSGGYWTESSTLDYLSTTTNKVAIGATSLISTEKVLINGVSDIIQCIVRGYSTQTGNIFEVRKSDNTVLFGVSNASGSVFGGTSAAITSNGTNVPLILTGNGTAGVEFGNAHSEKIVALTDGATPALDASLGNNYTLTAAGNRTIAQATNTPATGYTQRILLYHTASGGARTLAFNASGYDTTGITIVSTASGKTDVFGLVWNQAAGKYYVVAQVQGYA